MLREGGGPERVNKQHAAGKLTARERIDELVDPGSFDELMLFAEHRATLFGMDGRHFPGEAVVVGTGTVQGRAVHLASQDCTVAAGSVGEVHSDKIARMMQDSLDTGTPFVMFNDSAGARIQEGIDGLVSIARMADQAARLSGEVPQIALICGSCTGAAAFIPELMDFVIQTRHARMYFKDPGIIQQVTGDTADSERLAEVDAHMHLGETGHFVAEDDCEAAEICRRLLSFLPSYRGERRRAPCQAPVEPDETLDSLMPGDGGRGYDMKGVIRRVVDDADFLEVHAGHAQNMVVGFARLAGHTVGVVANQPMVLAGCIDSGGASKTTRFVRFCDAFDIPVVNFIDVPGFQPGLEQDRGGAVHYGAALLKAYSRCAAPVITVIVGKAYGAACMAMGARHAGARKVLAWPSAEFAMLAMEGAASVVPGPDSHQPTNTEQHRHEMTEHERSAFASPYIAAARGLVDEVIDPAWTRPFLARAVEIFRGAPGRRER